MRQNSTRNRFGHFNPKTVRNAKSEDHSKKEKKNLLYRIRSILRNLFLYEDLFETRKETNMASPRCAAAFYRTKFAKDVVARARNWLRKRNYLNFGNCLFFPSLFFLFTHDRKPQLSIFLPHIDSVHRDDVSFIYDAPVTAEAG